MTYALILTILHGSSLASIAVLPGFHDQQTCQQAGSEWQKRAKQDWTTYFVCVKHKP